ncbi:MAG: YifB family Mg chelatase-like AAA ATPase [Granulosicoccus sp.]|nr:YifB family Mg chelatase-like AAA ATPase [Granulosicoccus sp.]
MSYATVRSCALAGVQALPITVEVRLAGGLPAMSIVGLPQSAVRESKDRVRSAIEHAGLDFPTNKVIVNLAPADIPKQGGRFDLPIALCILLANGNLPASSFKHLVIVGELGLTGQIREVKGVLPSAASISHGNSVLLVPQSNIEEALLSQHPRILSAATLADALQLIKSPQHWNTHFSFSGDSSNEVKATCEIDYPIDMSEVVGQHQARRAIEVAAAGSHNVLMVGPPGTGKSMLATRLPTIQPAMTHAEAMETASVLSISRSGFDERTWGQRPFRAPHHTASSVALVGGGGNPMPGEVSLAHNGVLFLDELPEFSRQVLEVLREPMESRFVTLSRAARQATYPAAFQLIAAMNPCPCGYHGDPDTLCRCTPDQVLRYQARISGPFLDRLDLHLSMARPPIQAWREEANEESSETIRARVVKARALQMVRQGFENTRLSVAQLKTHANLTQEAKECLALAVEKLNLSLRSMHRIQRVARTVADLDGCVNTEVEHMAEALSYRSVQKC